MVAASQAQAEEVSMEQQKQSLSKASDDALEVSHETLWTSMQTVIVHDSTGAQARKCAVEDSSASDSESSTLAHAGPTLCGPARAKQRAKEASDSESSTSDSDGGTPCRVVDVESTDVKDGVTLADILDGGCTNSNSKGPSIRLGITSEGALVGEASQEGDTDEVRLPSIKKAQQQLHEILSRRSEIDAISSKYSPANKAGCPKAQTAVSLKISSECITLPPTVCTVDATVQVATCAGTTRTGLPHGIETKMSSTVGAEVANALPGPSCGTLPRSVRVCGPSARPDKAQVSDVMRQLGAGLGRLAAQPYAVQHVAARVGLTNCENYSQGTSGQDAGPHVFFGDKQNQTPISQQGGPAPYSSPAERSCDDFTSIADAGDARMTGTTIHSGPRDARCADDVAVSAGTAAACAAVSHTASRYLVSDGAASHASSVPAEPARSIVPSGGNARAWPIDKEKLQAGRDQEQYRTEELWHQFPELRQPHFSRDAGTECLCLVAK
mmetsp:Transcript_96047/g.266829  ORF Transcript_96047/g.266829 Transcript_96047/m.266829 type:complete len:497 (-) Transcript_96047:70-1560(-)